MVATIPVGTPVGQWTELTAALTGVTGGHDVYFTFTGPDDANLFEIDSWAFEPAPSSDVAAVAGTRCAGRKAEVTVRVRNDEEVHV